MKTFAAIFIIAAVSAAGAESLALKATVPLPTVKGRFDHFAEDTNTHRVFAAALGNNTVEIIDRQSAKRLHTITGQHKPCGIAFLSAQNQIAVANGDDGTLKIYDATSYQLLKNIAGLEDADNVRFDARAQRLYVGYGDGALAAFDIQNWQRVATIKLKAHPESFQLEQNGPRIFVNVPESKHVAVVDRQSAKTLATWPMEKYRANFPMALDEQNRRLFLGCRQPARLVVLDTQSGKPITDFEISGDTDDLFWDAARQQLYVICGEGFADVFNANQNTFTRTARITTRADARTGYFSPAFSELYVAVPDRNAPAELRIFTAP
jgi:DNA-binding beta-propeller fold protein YncE